jgi:hypothetical protein
MEATTAKPKLARSVSDGPARIGLPLEQSGWVW